MKFYAIHDYPDCPSVHDMIYAHWQGVWANSQTEAVTLYWQHYSGEYPPGECIGNYAVSIDEHYEWDLLQFAPDEPGIERRCEVLRLAGWGVEGETRCDQCDLYAYDLPEYAVCPSCCVCRGCGCDCDTETETEDA